MTITAAQHNAPARRNVLRTPWHRSSLVPYVLITPAMVCLLTFSVLSIFVAALVSLGVCAVGAEMAKSGGGGAAVAQPPPAHAPAPAPT